MSEHIVFAKLLTTSRNGQVLVIRDLCDEGKPEIKVIFNHALMDALATVTASFGYSDGGWQERDDGFERATTEWAQAFVDKYLGCVK